MLLGIPEKIANFPVGEVTSHVAVELWRARIVNSPDGSFVATELDNNLARLLVPGKIHPRCYLGPAITKNVVARHDDIQIARHVPGVI